MGSWAALTKSIPSERKNRAEREKVLIIFGRLTVVMPVTGAGNCGIGYGCSRLRAIAAVRMGHMRPNG